MSTLKTYILEKLPYTKPFLFVDEIFKVDDNGIEGAYTFKEDEYFYDCLLYTSPSPRDRG